MASPHGIIGGLGGGPFQTTSVDQPVNPALVTADDGAPVTIEIDQAQSANGICTISGMTLERRGSRGTLRFHLGHDRDDDTVYEFAAALPAGVRLVGLPAPATDNTAHEIPTEVGYRRVSDTAFALNRSNTIDAVCDYWFELTFDGFGAA